MKNRALVRFAIALSIFASISGCGSSEACHVCNVHTVVPGLLMRGCQPNERGMLELREKFGVRTIVNLNNLTPIMQGKVAARLGLNYLALPDIPIWEGDNHHVHINFLKEVRNAKTNGDAVVYVHCATGTDRVGLAIAVYRIVECGWDAQRTLDELHLYQSWFFRILFFRYPAYLRDVEKHRADWLAELERLPDPPVRRWWRGTGTTAPTTRPATDRSRKPGPC